ncbi:MAG: FkbM family methyltransferase [Hyphomicrobium sp.]
MSMVSTALAGVFRSLRLYQGYEAPRYEMDDLYARFVKPGDLVFDIGAHVGDRVSSFRRLGARVVAIEPQPLLFRALRLIHGRDEDVTLLEIAAAAQRSDGMLRINTSNPTVSTLSEAFIANAEGRPGWEGQVWDGAQKVQTVTIDDLIDAFEAPAFIKIDVEGGEAETLAGLSSPVAALSFEVTTIAREVALSCLDRIAALGNYGFDIALGESQRCTFGHWVTGAEMAAHLINLPHDANSGDVYAVRLDAA